MATVTPGGVSTERATLARMVRVMFPHPDFPDGPYDRTVDAILAAGTDDIRTAAQLQQGLQELDVLAGGSFTGLDDAKALALLRSISGTAFFQAVRSTVITSLYDDAEVHRLLGYEGASFDRGGYLHRGFDDLDWLPTPRIEEYDGPEALVEVAPDDVPENDGGSER
jgi:hypothetical protein